MPSPWARQTQQHLPNLLWSGKMEAVCSLCFTISFLFACFVCFVLFLRNPPASTPMGWCLQARVWQEHPLCSHGFSEIWDKPCNVPGFLPWSNWRGSREEWISVQCQILKRTEKIFPKHPRGPGTQPLPLHIQMPWNLCGNPAKQVLTGKIGDVHKD